LLKIIPRPKECRMLLAGWGSFDTTEGGVRCRSNDEMRVAPGRRRLPALSALALEGPDTGDSVDHQACCYEWRLGVGGEKGSFIGWPKSHIHLMLLILFIRYL
jgi:hypothetical protein